MDFFAIVFQNLGPLDAVCCCFPPGAEGGSGLPWYLAILNFIGVYKVRRAESTVFLGLAPGHLAYLALGSDGEVVTKAMIPLTSITGAQVTPKDEWSHTVMFTANGQPHRFVTCGYLFGNPTGTPPEIQGQLKHWEQQIAGTLANCR